MSRRHQALLLRLAHRAGVRRRRSRDRHGRYDEGEAQAIAAVQSWDIPKAVTPGEHVDSPGRVTPVCSLMIEGREAVRLRVVVRGAVVLARAVARHGG